VFYYLFCGVSNETLTGIGLSECLDYHYLRGGFKGVTKDSAIDLGVCCFQRMFICLHSFLVLLCTIFELVMNLIFVALAQTRRS
jgi:hypothetical protein